MEKVFTKKGENWCLRAFFSDLWKCRMASKHEANEAEKTMTSYDHNKIAELLAKKLRTKHRLEGVDIVSKNRAMEVAVTSEDLRQSIPQLNRSRAKKKYIVVPPPLYQEAKKKLKGTGIGIMNPRGQIRKRSRRK